MCRLSKTILVTLLLSLLTSCAPRTVRIAPGDIPPAPYLTTQDEQYGHEVLNQLSQEYPIDNDQYQTDRVRDIVDRLTKAAGADQDPWHVYVLKGDNFKNAAATKGNHVFVWTGLLGVVHSDSELATIIAHEIGHVLCGHTAADPSQEAASILSGTAGNIVSQIMSTQGGIYSIAADLAGALVQQTINAVAVNPDLQRKELEADQVGLFIMADAGYDPQDALEFWDRVKNDPDFTSGNLAFFSTHPTSEERLERLSLLFEQADERYRRSMPTSKTRRK